jgi:hypothetical protein
MKLFTNLPGSLFFLFGILRTLIVLFAALWLFTLTFAPWIQDWFPDEPKLMVTVGEVLLRVPPDFLALDVDGASTGSLSLSSVRGTLQMDLISNKPTQGSALRWTVFPAMLVFLITAWVTLSSLRSVCANIGRGEVFSEGNLRKVRTVGLTLIAYSFAQLLVGLWSSSVMQGYLTEHVTLVGFRATTGVLGVLMPSGFGALITGCLVLVVSEAFRQGLALKTENELTI